MQFVNYDVLHNDVNRSERSERTVCPDQIGVWQGKPTGWALDVIAATEWTPSKVTDFITENGLPENTAFVQKGKTISFQALNWTQRTELKDKADGALDADGEVYRCKFSPFFNEQHTSQRNTTYINVEPKEPEASSSSKQAIVHTGQTSLLPTTHTPVKSDFDAPVDKRFTDLGNSHEALKEEFGTLKTSGH